MEYIIIDSNNQWLATENRKKDARIKLRELISLRKNGDGYGETDEIGETLYLYEAKEITRSELN